MLQIFAPLTAAEGTGVWDIKEELANKFISYYPLPTNASGYFLNHSIYFFRGISYPINFLQSI